MCAAWSSVMLWCSKQFQFYSFCPSCSKVCVSEGLKSMQTVFSFYQSFSGAYRIDLRWRWIIFSSLFFLGIPHLDPWNASLDFTPICFFDLARGDKERTADSHIKWLKRLKSHVEMSSKWVLLGCFGTIPCHAVCLECILFQEFYFMWFYPSCMHYSFI